MPFLAEELYQNLVGERYAGDPESVHLCDWPEADETLIDEDLSFRMEVARQVVNLGRAARMASQLKTRQPLAAAVVACGEAERAAVESLADVVTEELNVKALEFVDSAADLVSYQVKPNYRTLGPRFGKSHARGGGRCGGAAGGRGGARLSRPVRPSVICVGGHDHELCAGRPAGRDPASARVSRSSRRPISSSA